MSIIDQLRLNPRPICVANGIRTGPEAGSFVGTQQGGQCQINEASDGTDVYTLTATAGAGTDYYFPWLQRSWTYVRVPQNVPNGTIVMTGGVNGCSLIVSDDHNDYVFYHDGDSKYLPVGSNKIVGNEIVRIVPADYDPNDYTQTVFTSYLQSYKKAKLPMPSGDISYGNFVLFVKVNGQFDACATAVLSLGKPMALKGHYILSF